MDSDLDPSACDAIIASAREFSRNSPTGHSKGLRMTSSPSSSVSAKNPLAMKTPAAQDSPPPSDNKCSLSLRLEIGKPSSREAPSYTHIDILLELGKYIDPKKILSLGKLRALDHWSLALFDSETYDKVFNIPELIVAARPVEISILSQALAQCRVQWLPTQLENADIVSCFAKYGRIHNFWVENLREENFTHILTGVRGFDIELKDGIRREDLPHIFKVHGFEGLLVVKGRAPKCLRCGTIGHISRNCPKKLAQSEKPTFAETAALDTVHFPPLPHPTRRSKVELPPPDAEKNPVPTSARAMESLDNELTEALDFSFVSSSVNKHRNSRPSSPDIPDVSPGPTSSAAAFLKNDPPPATRSTSRKKKRRSTPEKKGPFEGQPSASISNNSSASGPSSARLTAKSYPDWSVDHESG